MFTKHSFHWRPRRFSSDETQVDKAVAILNQLTPEQQEAVELYARSQYEEGYDSGAGN